MNEITGAVKWPYDPIIHFPKGDVEDWSHLGSGVYEAAEYIVTGVCKGDLNPYVHGAAGEYFFSATTWNLR